MIWASVWESIPWYPVILAAPCKKGFLIYADSKGPDQPWHPCSLIRAYCTLTYHWIIQNGINGEKRPGWYFAHTQMIWMSFLRMSKSTFLLDGTRSTHLHQLTLRAPRKTASENVVCLCRLLNILANFSKPFFAYWQTVDPDQTAPKGAVWSGSTLFAEMTFKITSRRQSRLQLLWLAL